ncbi:right-handed parallel beta-helix repeat-containing protein [Nocardioides sp. HM23]|uniref:right-handed parallel beta-helix repeat-containing protein n=1 Tax=Nocardioides bizhenqiangii TaxID=3095076 RepID=UPI002ACA46EB|nr:right-handed parallel beta-helix repeat-containing protein [Nocardioides sp. HM23]MDZ5622522.1 right-handed parallel beta-helix repeat-containing protein [Nocardioides sp. HM23]
MSVLGMVPSSAQAALPGAFVVNSTVDAVDANIGDGVCKAAGGNCTLRAATQEANAKAGPDVIHILPGTYAIGLAPINENAANVGDFEITDPVTIEKAPDYLGDVIIDGGTPLPSSPVIARGLDRLFEIHPGAGDVTMRNVTLQNGYSPEEGGAIQNWSLGKLTLDGVTVKDSYAEKAGGGVNNGDVHDYPWTTEPPSLDLLPYGRIDIMRSTFTGNGSGGGTGGAINNTSGGTITISAQTRVTLNPGPIKPDPLDPEEMVLADPSDYPIAASAIANLGEWQAVGTIRISDSTVSLNAAEGNGGGVLNEGDGIVEVTNSTLTENHTSSSGGGLYTEGGKVTVSGSTISKNDAANGGGLYSGGHESQHGLRGTFTVKSTQFIENTAENGGGLFNDGDAQMSVTDSTFARNHSSDHGAAISSEGRASLTLTRVTVRDNESWGEGGGVWTHSERKQVIADSTFTNNHAGVPHLEEDGLMSDDVAGGGGLHTDGGLVTVRGSTFDGNDATDEGGGLSLHNLGDIEIVDTTITNNHAFDGGGLENSAHEVTFRRVTISGNRAAEAGGGIYNTSSGEFHINDSTIRGNTAQIGGGLANAPDQAIIVRGSLFLNNTARIGTPGEDGELPEEAGRGGGIMSFADGDSLYENTTISGNKAAVAGGGLFHDADGELRLVHMTIWRNSAPTGGGIGVVESDFVPPVPPAANSAVILKNSIVGGSVKGGNCDWYVRSEGGNLETGEKNTCFLAVTAETAESPIELGVRDRRGDPQLLAIADNGGPTLTHALQYGSLAIDSSKKPCSTVDQRGIVRPQNGRCDAGAYEYVGDPPVTDNQPPETEFNYPEDGPFQDALETMAFRFRGTDNQTAPHELNFECRFLELDLVEEPEPVAPWDPIPPEEMWNGCSSPWSVPLPEEGLFRFEVRAIDRADNTDPTPVSQLISGVGMTPPDTKIVEAPGLTPGQTVPPAPATTPRTNSRSALFSFMAISDFTPSQFAEYECRLDSRDPDMWLECFNPTMFSDLATGLHTFEVRAIAGEAAGPDPTPARYTWRVGPDPDDPGATPISCDEANITLTASADGWADQVNPLENYWTMTELEVRSGATDPGNGQPLTPQNARSFFRFPLQSDAPDCELESATLRLYSGGHTEDRTLAAVPLAETWKESTLTWVSQPDPVPGGIGATTAAGEGYREFDVKAHIEAIFAGELPNHGWVIRDRHENDLEGGDQNFISREAPQDPPEITLPELELRFEPADTPPPPPRDDTLVDRVVACGEVITESTRLMADVTGCLSEGIAIGAPNIILDLNGHTVRSGLLLEPGEEDNLTPGIRNGYPNVEIRNGTVTNYGYGVLLGPGSTHSEVHDMTLVRNALTGVQLFDADNGRIGNWVHDNVFDSNGETGLQLMSGTEGALIENNYFVSNGMSIHLFDSHRNLIRNNTISGIIIDPALDSDAGIVLDNGSRNNVLENNDISDTGDAGIVIHQGSHGNIVRGGVLVRNGDAGVIVQDADRIEVDGILAHQQSDGGVVLSNSSNSVVKNSDLRYNPSGVDASGTNNLIVENNNASNSLQTGIALGDGVNMIVRNNTANRTGGAGISVDASAFDATGNAVGGALVEGNTTNENAESGISATTARHTIRGNTANLNSGYGIEAGEESVAGEPPDPNRNIDGGGNKAAGNHSDGVTPGLPDALQCLGVVCETVDPGGVTEPDLEAPQTTITVTPPAVTGNETSVFEFTANDGPTGDPVTAMTFECRIDAPPDPPVPPEDPELEPPDPTEPPDLPEPPEGEFWVACSSPLTYLSLEPAMDHHFEVRAVDQAGNFDLTPAEYTWRIEAGVHEDGTEECGPGETLGVDCKVAGAAPDTRITAAPGELITDAAGTRYDTTNQAATFKFTGSDNLTAGYNLRYECRTYFDEFNDELTPADIPETLEWGSCGSPKSYANLAHGGHIFQVRSVDLVANKDTTPASHAWWIHPPPPDTTAPDTEIVSGPDPTTVQTSATFTFTGSDNQTPTEELAFQCRLDGALEAGQPAWTTCTSPYTVNGLTPAQHVLQVRAVDLGGNVDDVNGSVDNPSAPVADDPSDGVPAAYVWKVGTAPVTKTVFCGQKVTQSIKVNNNLADCLAHGLIVGADNITIDLNGKTIDGKSIGAAILNNGYDSVTIKNGRLTDFDYGVMLNNGAELNIVEGITADLNQDAAISLGHGTFPEDPNLAPAEPVPGFRSGVDNNILRSNTLVSNKRGVWLLNGAKDNVVRGNLIGSTSDEAVWIERAESNLVEGNDIQSASKGGVLLEGATDNTILENSIVGAGSGVIVRATTSGTIGIESTGNLVQGNHISDSAGPSLEIESSSANQLIDNIGELSDSYAIELYRANDNLVRGNDVSGNKGGVSLRESTGNLIEGNDTSNSDSTGITLESQSFSNTLLNNSSSNNVGGGIYIGDEAPAGQGTLVQGNTTNSNKSEGIKASKPSHIFKDNVATDNDSWGIYVGDPSNGRANIDGGGNIAQGNDGPLGVDLKPQQCYNISCLGGPGGGDQIAPNTNILETPLDQSTESVAVFRFTGADNSSPVTFECRFAPQAEFADAGWQACTSPKTYQDLVNDTYSFEVRAVDFSGNADQTPASYTWAVELGDFKASIDSAPDRVTVDTGATFEFSANRSTGVDFQCVLQPAGGAVDWASASACTSPKTYAGLEPGQYEFWVRATDTATSTYDTQMYSWTVGPPPVAARVNCGQILTESTRVLNDLVDCGGHGLIVGAPGITIDLDGHVIDGLGLDAGILNNGHDDVTITNGLITQFLYGVQLNPGTARNVVHDLRIEGNEEAGIALSDADQGADGNTIRDNSIVANEIGIALYTGTRHAVIRGNTLAANLGEGAIVLEFASENLIEGNQIGQSAASGVSLLGGGSNTVTDNVLKDNGGMGIMAGDDLLQSNNNLIQRNTIRGGQGGVMVAGDGNTVINNEALGTTGPGVTVELATNTVVKGNDFSGSAGGIVVGEATNTLIEANNASGTLGSGIEVGEFSLDSVVRDNTASGNGGAGIEITESSVLDRGTLVENNTTDANGGDGIYVEGAGHEIKGNVAQLNGGWGIYSVGAEDGGGNFAAGNMEPDQCFGVVCELGTVPGAPDTWIVSGPQDANAATPAIESNSRNASFTYLGADDTSPITDLVFECRLDSTNSLAWEDCEYPAEYLNLSPGEHTLDIRAIDMLGQGLADPTPASFTWTYVPLPTGVAPEVILDVVPETPTFLFDAIFTFHANEPDVTFQCKVDANGYEPCGFEAATYMSQGAYEWALAENEVGQHTFSVRAIDFEGNVGAPTTFTWELMGVNVVVTDGPGFVPASGGPQGDPATGGPTASTSAEITFEANVADAQFWCRFDSMDPGDYFPCESPFRVGPAFAGDTEYPDPLLPGDHVLEVYGESETMGSAAELEPTVYEWEVVDAIDTLPPETTIERAPVTADLSSTVFEFSGVDDLTPEFLLTFECQVTNGTAPPNDLNWVACTSPFNLLDAYSYADPEMSMAQHTFYVRAVDMSEPEFPNPNQPEFEGNPDPTPASFTWTPVADTRDPVVNISGGPADGATVGQEPELYTFSGLDNATPLLLLEFECAAYLTAAGVESAEWASCESPVAGGYDISGLEPGAYTVAVRATDLAGNIGPAATRAVTVSGAPVVTFLSGPDGRLDPVSGEPDGASGTENAVFTFESDQPGSTFECSVDGADYLPCGGTTLPASGAAWVVDNGEHQFSVRATNAQGIVGEEAAYEWLVQLSADVNAPTSQFRTGPENGTLLQEAIFTFTGTDNRTPSADLAFECALDSTTSWNSCTSPEQFSDLTRGTHTLRLRAVDAAGNIQATPAVYTWTVAPPPVVTILSGPGVDQEETTDRTVTFTYSADVSPVTFHCWLDGKFNPHAPGDPTKPAPCDPAGETYADLGIGEHLFAVRAVDEFGNIGVWEDSEFRVTPSEARITSAPASGTNTTASFEFTSDPSDPNAVFYCSLDDRPFSLCNDTPVDGSPGTYRKTYTNLWAGEHTFQVQTLYTGVDWQGLPFEHDPIPAEHTWTVQDFTAPDTTIEFGPPATTTSTTAYLQVNSDDPTATIECTLTGPTGTEQGECEPGVITEFTDLVPGDYTFSAVATDLSGNVDPSPATHEWTIGTPSGPPNTPVGDNVTVTVGDVKVTYFEVETAGTTTANRLGGGPSLPEGYGGGKYYEISTTAVYSEPITVCINYDPADFGGSKSLRLLSFDGEVWLDVTTLHNPFSTPARVCSNIAEDFGLFAIARASSGMAPETSILSGPEGPLGPDGLPTSTSGSATFEFWTDQENAITQCSLDGDPYFYCESPLTVGPLEEGGHELLVQAVNDFGWMDLTPALYEWEVIGPDVTPPTTTITSGPPEGSQTPNFISNFEFAGTDDMTPTLELEFECTLDGEAIGGCESPEEIEVTTPGEHTLLVQAIDGADNIDPVGATRTWTVVDMSGPDTEILVGPEEETTETSATFEFEGFELLNDEPVNQFECALDDGEFAPCSSPHTIAGPLGGGVHVFHVRAVDPDGNKDISPAFYEWMILGADDTTPPDTFITTYPNPANSGPDVTFGFASNEPVESFECSWGTGTPPAAPTTWEECETVLLLEALDSGQHWLWVRALDAAEIPNVDPTPAGRDRGFGPNDTEPFVWTTTGEPETIIDSGPADPTGSYTATFEFHSDQPGATFQCSVNGSPYVGCSSGYQAGPFLPGEGGEPEEHEFEVRAVNQYRNADGEQVMDLSPATYTWTVQDVTPPETEFLGATEIGPEQFVDPGLRFTFRGDDEQASSFELEFECAITNSTAGDAPVWEGCGEPAAGDSFFHEIAFEDYLESPGDYTFQVRGVDLAGNADETPVPQPAYEFTIEGEPETAIDTVTPAIAEPDLETTSTTVTFTFSGTGASFLCRLDSETGPFVECPGGAPGQATYTDVPYGEHAFEVAAVGEHGTLDSTPALFEWVSGTNVAPDVTINQATAPPATGGTATTGTIEFSSTDPQATFLCVLDGGPELPCISPITYTNLPAGEQNPHAFEVTATRADLLPSVPLNTALHEWVIADEAAPEARLLEPLPTDPSADEVTFTFTGSDNGTTAANLEFECRLDGGEWIPCSSPHTIPDLTGGEHTFAVRAIDETALTSAPVSHTWDVIAPPLTTITNQVAGADVPAGETSASATGELSFFDQPGSTYECRLDAQYAADPDAVPWEQDCTSPYPYDLANGEHVFEVRAKTLPLNGQTMTESPAAEYSWMIDAADTTAPNTAINLGPANPTSNTSATFLFDGTDNLTAAADLTFECSLDGATFEGCASGDVYADLAVGDHTFAVRAIDGAGNTDDSPAEQAWTIEAPTANNTDVGTNVAVSVGGANITFAEVTAAGATSVSTITAGSAPDLPNGYDAADALYYDVSTTAQFVGNVTVCLPYDALVDAHVLHFDGEWVDVTLEQQGGLVCGVVSSLSPFAVAEASAEVAPDTTIIQAPEDPTVQTTADGADVQFQFSSTIDSVEHPASFECRLDAEQWSSCDSPYQFNALLGEHTLRVRALTDTGVLDATPAVYTWTVLARPVATVDSGPEDQEPSTPDVENESRTATFEFSSDQPGSTFECRLTSEAGGTTWQACTSPKTYQNLALEEHTFEVQAINAAGHASFLPAQFEWEVADLTAPHVTIDSGPTGTVDASTATFDFSAGEPVIFECSLDGAPFGACQSGIRYTGLERGSHTFDVRAEDLSEGENASETVRRTWTVADLTAPVITISEKPTATTSETTAQFSFSTSDNWGGAVTTECRLEGGTFAPCTSPKSYSGLSDGEHTFVVRATDSADNARTETHTWTVEDVVDPEAQITNVTSGSLVVEFTGTDDHTAVGDLRFECRVDSAGYGACTSPKTYTSAELSAMSPGDHTFQVRAIDQAGNVGQPDSRTFTVADTTAPNTTITGAPTNNTTNTSASFAFAGSDDGTPAAGLTFECKLDTGSFEPCTTPKAYTGLSVGQHTFEVRAKDQAGNTDQSSASRSWTIQAPADTTAPDTSISAQPPATTVETNASFGFTSTETGSTFECKLDTGGYEPCTTPKAYTGLAVGQHTFSVRAKDAAGNQDQSAASYSWTIQSTTVNCGATQTLTATRDAWIDAGSTTSNKGSDSTLKVMSKSGGNLRALVGFNLPTMPPGCTVASATLRLYAKSAASGRTVQVFQLGGSWTEGAVTWANQPVTTGPAVTTNSGTGYREWNVAGMVQAMYTGANHGFLLGDSNEDQDAEQQFHSREESTNRPQLVITFGTGAPPDGVPETQITGSPLPATSSTSASFTFTGTDDTTPAGSLTFECQLDVPETSSWAPCTNPRNYSSLADGSHTFRVRAKDASGNVDPTAAVHAWTIDRTEPETVLTGGPAASTTSKSAQFAFQSPESGTTFTCSLDQGPYNACISPKDYTNLSVGQHTFRVRATDAAGNTDQTPASQQWTIQSGGTPVNCGSAQTVTSVADAWIDQSSASANKGGDSILKVMSKGSANLRALIRFNLPTIPAGCVVDTAKLRLYAASASGSQRTLQVLRLGGSWTESSVTWATAPQTTGAAVTTTSATGYREWNVAAMVQAMFSSGSNHGFLVKDATEGQDAEQQFHAREKGSNLPQLVLTFKPAS